MKDNNGNEFSINFSAMIAEIKNQTLNKMIVGSMPNDKDARMIYKMLRAFNRRGITSEVVIEVLMEAFREE